LIKLFRCLFYNRQRKLSPLGNNICHCIDSFFVQSFQSIIIINHNKNTKAKLLALEKHLNQIIDAQTINTEQQISLEALGDVSVEFSNSRGV
ncbi:MAG TPA: hypothetical protein LFW10_04515, partial [Rickettsia endosymbiont of Diachasma alloeum]|nr:hypothetical protein [Rickettsia endosymbiont of Diachasma alloeum]